MQAFYMMMIKILPQLVIMWKNLVNMTTFKLQSLTYLKGVQDQN